MSTLPKRDSKGRILPGYSGNASGGPKAKNVVKALIEKQIFSPEFAAEFVKQYDKLMKAGHPSIVKDYADRTMGRAKESGDQNEAKANPLQHYSTEELLKLLKADAQDTTGTEVSLAVPDFDVDPTQKN